MWRNPDLVMDDHGTLSTAFLPDGRVYPGAAAAPTGRSRDATISLRAGGYSDFDSTCRALAR